MCIYRVILLLVSSPSYILYVSSSRWLSIIATIHRWLFHVLGLWTVWEKNTMRRQQGPFSYTFSFSSTSCSTLSPVAFKHLHFFIPQSFNAKYAQENASFFLLFMLKFRFIAAWMWMCVWECLSVICCSVCVRVYVYVYIRRGSEKKYVWILMCAYIIRSHWNASTYTASV